jgi:hypothetical protein
MTKALSDRIAAAKAKKEKAVKRLNALEGKAKNVERKNATRRKIVIGAVTLAYMEQDPMFAEGFKKLLAHKVVRPQDRQAIADLLPPESATPAPEPN